MAFKIFGFAKTPVQLLAANGITVTSFMTALTNIPRYMRDLARYKSLMSKPDKHVPLTLFPILSDYDNSSGFASGHYFWQDLIVAQDIFLSKPDSHLDIGSRIDGLVAHLASFMKLTVMDIRPLPVQIPNVTFIKGSLLSPDHSLKYSSISCLHVLEHIGLGRYSDPINGTGFYDGLSALFSLLSSNGILYISFPVGIEKIFFNAHRVLNLRKVLTFIDMHLCPSDLQIKAFIDDSGNLHFSNPYSLTEIITLSESSSYACCVLKIQK